MLQSSSVLKQRFSFSSHFLSAISLFSPFSPVNLFNLSLSLSLQPYYLHPLALQHIHGSVAFSQVNSSVLSYQGIYLSAVSDCRYIVDRLWSLQSLRRKATPVSISFHVSFSLKRVREKHLPFKKMHFHCYLTHNNPIHSIQLNTLFLFPCFIPAYISPFLHLVYFLLSGFVSLALST